MRLPGKVPIGLFGYDEVGEIGLYAAAARPRIDAACVNGYFDNRNDLWRHPSIATSSVSSNSLHGRLPRCDRLRHLASAPKGSKEGEKRPVVVCQHGLEGRPSDPADPTVDSPCYHRFAVRLAEQGFITFAPQNLYIFGDRFRTLQRKANPLKKTLFSVIVPQHQQITDWLKSFACGRPHADRLLRCSPTVGESKARSRSWSARTVNGQGDACISATADFNELGREIAELTSARVPIAAACGREFLEHAGRWPSSGQPSVGTLRYAEMAALIRRPSTTPGRTVDAASRVSSGSSWIDPIQLADKVPRLNDAQARRSAATRCAAAVCRRPAQLINARGRLLHVCAAPELSRSSTARRDPVCTIMADRL